MCNIIIESKEENKDFLIYNYIFSQNQVFTVEKIHEDMIKKIGVLDIKYIKNLFDFFVQVGLLNQHINGYSVHK